VQAPPQVELRNAEGVRVGSAGDPVRRTSSAAAVTLRPNALPTKALGGLSPQLVGVLERLAEQRRMERSYEFRSHPCPTCSIADAVGYAPPIAPSTLFGPAGALPGDVKQGGVGDCYFMATMMSIARKYPRQLRALFRQEPDGTYTVLF